MHFASPILLTKDVTIAVSVRDDEMCRGTFGHTLLAILYLRRI